MVHFHLCFHISPHFLPLLSMPLPPLHPQTHTDISPTHTKDANTAIVMKNVKPIAWTGRRINCQLYRNGYLYAIQRDVPPNSSAYFALSHKLTFGIVMTQCIEPGTILPLSQVQYQWYLDMTEYVGCQLLTVSVEFNKCSGEFVFSETQQC